MRLTKFYKLRKSNESSYLNSQHLFFKANTLTKFAATGIQIPAAY